MKKIYLLFLLCYSFTSLYGQDGIIDSSFGSYGMSQFTSSVNSTNGILSYSIDINQSTKKIIQSGLTYGDTANTNDTLVLGQYNSDGSIDTSFGFKGLSKYAYTKRIQSIYSKYLSNGKILCVGYTDGSHDSVYLFRLNANGALDSSYGNNGSIIISNLYMIGSPFFHISEFNILNNDDILLGLQTLKAVGILKINNSGIVDSSFGRYGIAMDSAVRSEYIWAKNVQKDGKIVIAGESTDGSSYSLLLLKRYYPNGNLDTTFGNGGTKLDYFSSNLDVNWATQVAFQSDGKIIVYGNVIPAQGTQKKGHGIRRYYPDGTRDTSFGNQGLVTVKGALAASLLIDHDDRILYQIINYDLIGPISEVYRLSANGVIDSNFGVDMHAEFPDLNQTDRFKMYDMKLQSSYRLIEAGDLDSGTSVNHMALIAHKLNNPLSIKDVSTEISDLLLYPNPTKSELFINYKGNSEKKVSIDLYNNTGQRVKNIENFVLQNAKPISVESLPEGNYILTITGKQGKSSFMITKE